MSTGGHRRSTRASERSVVQPDVSADVNVDPVLTVPPPVIYPNTGPDTIGTPVTSRKRTLPSSEDTGGRDGGSLAAVDGKRAKLDGLEVNLGSTQDPHSLLVDDDRSDHTLSLGDVGSTTPSDGPDEPPMPTAPSVNAHHPLFHGADHVPVEALERSLDFLRLADNVNYRFALGQLPAAAKWGTRYESEKYLCINNQRITVWVIGVVKSTWFTGEGGAPAARVSVGVHLPFEGDLDALHDLHKRGRPTPTKFTDRAFASCFQSRRPKGSSELVTLTFDRIYNATEKFQAKSKMPKIHHSNLGRGDYILLEAWVNRYKTAGDKKAVGDWTEWMVSLEMREVSVLFATPDGYIDEDDAPPADINDNL